MGEDGAGKARLALAAALSILEQAHAEADAETLDLAHDLAMDLREFSDSVRLEPPVPSASNAAGPQAEQLLNDLRIMAQSLIPDSDYATAKPQRFTGRVGDAAIVIALDADVAAAFPTSEAVHKALRLVMQFSSLPAAKPD